MRRLKIRLAGALIGVALGASTLLFASCGWEDGRCVEDEPCWNCHTMGNLVCGPVNE